MISAARHPCSSISQLSMGMKMVLAKPAIRVTAVRARVRLRSNQAVTTAKAGSYSTADMVTPMSAQRT